MSTDSRKDSQLCCSKCGQPVEPIEEYDIRIWFMRAALEQAEDTFRVCQGIIETRKEFQPKRKTRADKGVKRTEQDVIDLRELGK